MRDTGVGRMCLLPFFFRNASEPLHDNESMLERNEILFNSLVSLCFDYHHPNTANDATSHEYAIPNTHAFALNGNIHCN